MKKIPSLYMREEAPGGNRRKDLLVINEVNPECQWVLDGEGVATRKIDGTAVLVSGIRVLKRYDAKHGKTPPFGFEPAQDPDPVTGHWPGWLECSQQESADAWILLAFETSRRIHAFTFKGDDLLEDGTYEACGPMINGNAEKLPVHCLERHGDDVIGGAPRAFTPLRDFLADGRMEGIVWHHPDGRMAKIKTRDFGHAWPSRT